jgi:hypothetical protein
MSNLCRDLELVPQQIIDWRCKLPEGTENFFGNEGNKLEVVDLVPLQTKIDQPTLKKDCVEPVLNMNYFKGKFLSVKR